MAVPVLQTLVGLIVALSGLAMAGRAPTTKKEQWLYRSMFLFLGIVLLVLSWVQYLNVRKLESSVVEKAPAPIPAAVQPASVPAEKTAPRSDNATAALAKKYETLLRNLSKDPSLPADVRERIVIASATLSQEAQATQQRAGGESLIAAESAKAKVLPLFDYAIKTLAALSDKEAVSKGDRSALTYHGLPEDLNPDGTVPKRARKTAAEIHWQSNPNWDIQIYFGETTSPHYEASLSFTAKGGVLVLKSSADGIETHIQLLSGESAANKPAQGDQAKVNITTSLNKLLAAEAEAAEVSK